MSTESNTCVCLYCDNEYTSRGVTQHLYACDHRQNAIDQSADQRENQKLYHLKIQETWNSPRFGLCGYSGPAEPPY